MTILIAGASGYIGRSLIPELLRQYPESRILALSRTARQSEDPRVEWRTCDLFSLKDIEGAMNQPIDAAFYLVHSMTPTAHLDQGHFKDYDLIMADNFARALLKQPRARLIYLSGLLPKEKKLSEHLASRREVEQVFARYPFPATTYRAGLILGEGGSSFEIMVKLVRRLPVMICPSWTQTLTTPVDLTTVINTLAEELRRPPEKARTFDFAGCKPLTYIEMMQQTAEWLGLKRRFIPVPFFTPTLSRLWVTLITGQPKELVYPLVQSLKYEMVARPDHLAGSAPAVDYRRLLTGLQKPSVEKSKRVTFKPPPLMVRSVQRLPVRGWSAEEVMNEYLHWLPRFFRPLKVWADGERFVISFLFRKLELLAFQLSKERSTSDRQLLYIVGGILSGGGKRGRLEFREALGGRVILAAIHEFRPRLPWYIYQWTQAWIHLLTMRAFKWHLMRRP